jgi:hypothetical protein
VPKLHGLETSVIVHEFHGMSPFVTPNEADAPLIVDPNAPLTGTIAEQAL